MTTVSPISYTAEVGEHRCWGIAHFSGAKGSYNSGAGGPFSGLQLCIAPSSRKHIDNDEPCTQTPFPNTELQNTSPSFVNVLAQLT